MATQSPYVADSGSVGELGQPTSSAPHSTDHPSQAPADGGFQGKNREVREPTGLEETGAYGDTESIRPESNISQSVGVKTGETDHPLMATHDTNMPHVHDPLTSTEYAAAGVSPTGHQKRGVGEKLKNAARGLKDVVTGHKEKQQQHHQPPQGETSPGLAGKVNNAVTGQYPGQGTGTGNATAGGEEVVGDRTRPGVGQEHLVGDQSSGVNRKHEDYEDLQQHGRGHPGTDHGLKHETGWPKPVPPPSLYNPSMTAPEHYSPKADPSPAEDYAPKYAREEAGVQGRKDAAEANAPTYAREEPGVQGRKDVESRTDEASYAREEPGVQGDESRAGEGYASKYAGEEPGVQGRKDVESRTDEAYAPPYAREEPGVQGGAGEGYASKYAGEEPGVQGRQDVESSAFSGTVSGGSVEPSEGRAPLSSTPVNRAGDPKVDVTSGIPSLSSTPAEPDVKHDVPSVDNTGGQYADSAGNIRHEGPRDDNVKKEGLMAKMMDKLHLGSHDRQKHTTT